MNNSNYPGIPEGWRLVPVGMTPEWESVLADRGIRIGSVAHVVEDVLAAAPTPPAQASGQAAPSDEELLELGKRVELSIDPRYEFMGVARNLLSRYGQAPTASAEPVGFDRDALVDLIADHLSGTYHCTRVWEAWSVGTMSEEDFEDVGESETPSELADAIVARFAAPVADALEKALGRAAPHGGEGAAGQVEFLDVENHRLRRAMQKIMARLAYLLDEDQFGNIESIVTEAGVEPPLYTAQQMKKYARAAPSPQGDAWMRIEEDAPVDVPLDTPVLLAWWDEWSSEWKIEVNYAGSERGGWRHGRATHWQPLTAPPIDAARSTPTKGGE